MQLHVRVASLFPTTVDYCCLILWIIKKSLYLLYNHLMSLSKISVMVANFKRGDHAQWDLAICITVSAFFAHFVVVLTV